MVITVVKLMNIKATQSRLGKYWKILENIEQALGRCDKSAIIGQIIFNDQFLNEKQDIAEACNQYFASVGSKLADQNQPSQDNPVQHIPVGKERSYYRFTHNRTCF